MTEHPRNYSGLTRIVHWLNAFAILGLISSGWAIFNAAPFYPLQFPSWLALGGGLTGALRWHFALMWIFAACTGLLLTARVIAQAGGPALRPASLRQITRELKQIIRLNLAHDHGRYLHIQRFIYLGVIVLFIAAILSGLALWKPVQLQFLADGMGGYELARRIHFWAMAGIAAFILVHLVMVMLVPASLLRMWLGARVVEAGR